jgi:hypothetical protein
VVEIHNGVVRPELALDFLPGDNLSPALQQHSQYLESLFPQDDLAFAGDCTYRAQFARLKVKLKTSETDATWDRVFHGTWAIESKVYYWLQKGSARRS